MKLTTIVLSLAIAMSAAPHANAGTDAPAIVGFSSSTTLYTLPLPGESGFNSVEISSFAKNCVQLDTAEIILKKHGKDTKLFCQTPDGGRVGVTTGEHEAIFVIHQTKQMNGDAINEIANSFNVIAPLSSLKFENEQCKKRIQEARYRGDFGDLQIKLNSQGFNVICEGMPTASVSSTNPVFESLKAFGSFLPGRQ